MVSVSPVVYVEFARSFLLADVTGSCCGGEMAGRVSWS